MVLNLCNINCCRVERYILDGWRESEKIINNQDSRIVGCPDETGEKMSSSLHNNQIKNLQQLELIKFSFDHAAEAIFLLSRDGKIIYANNTAVNHTGYSQAELKTMYLYQIDCNYHRHRWPRIWQRVRKSGKINLETCHKSKHGKMIPVELNISFHEIGDIEFHCAFANDISERKENERILLKSESLLRKTLDVTSDGAWDRNIETGDVYYGERWATALGYNEEDLQTGKIAWDKLLHPEDREKAILALRDHLDGKTENYEAEFRLRNSDNNYQWIHARGQIIEYDKEGKPLRFVGTHTDITARKRLESSLLKSTEDTKLFAYSVAHDLKNPAIAIRNLAERFMKKMDYLPDEKKLLYAEKMIVSSNQIVDLVEKINTYISSKETQPSLEKVPLKEVIGASREEFAAQLQYRSIQWKECLENPVIKMDRLSVIRVLRNLVENSFKYGGSKLSTITIGYQNTAGFHVISVSDNGVGMNIEDSKRIFEPFKRKSGSVDQGGSGLGLAIVKEIANNHRGEVWVVPNKKRGVQFCFAISKNL